MHLILSVLMIWVGLGKDPSADYLLGQWYTEGKAALIEFSKNENGYFGKVLWLQDKLNNGKREIDKNNENPQFRKRPILGIQLIWSLHYQDGIWTGGWLYDPESGKTFRCLIKKKDSSTLEVRGYLGMPSFGRSVYWTRVQK